MELSRRAGLATSEQVILGARCSGYRLPDFGREIGDRAPRVGGETEVAPEIFAQRLEVRTGGRWRATSMSDSSQYRARAGDLGPASHRFGGLKRFLGARLRERHPPRVQIEVRDVVEGVGEMPFGIDGTKTEKSPFELAARVAVAAAYFGESGEGARERQLAAVAELGGERLEIGASLDGQIEPSSLEEQHDEPAQTLRGEPVIELACGRGPTVGKKAFRVVVGTLLVANEAETHGNIRQIELERRGEHDGFLEQRFRVG